MSASVAEILMSRNVVLSMLMVMIVLIVIGNLVLLFAIAICTLGRSFRGKVGNGDLQSSTSSLSSVQRLIAHNAIADLAFALATLTPQLAQFATAPRFYGGAVTCRMVSFLKPVPMYASSFLLVAISCDRYWAICFPLANLAARSDARATLLPIISWVLALLFSIPQAVFTRFIDEIKMSNYSDCVDDYSSDEQRQAFVILFSVVVWLAPTCAAAYFYSKVCITVWKQLSGLEGAIKFQELHKESANRRGLDPTIPLVKAQLSATCLQQLRQLDKQKLHTVKLTMCIVANSFLLWAPFCIMNVIYAIWPNFMSPLIATYGMLLGNLTSISNPWIYIAFQKEAIVSAIRKQCSSQTRIDNTTNFNTSCVRKNCRGVQFNNNTINEANTRDRLLHVTRQDHVFVRRSTPDITVAPCLSRDSQHPSYYDVSLRPNKIAEQRASEGNIYLPVPLPHATPVKKPDLSESKVESKINLHRPKPKTSKNPWIRAKRKHAKLQEFTLKTKSQSGCEFSNLSQDRLFSHHFGGSYSDCENSDFSNSMSIVCPLFGVDRKSGAAGNDSEPNLVEIANLTRARLSLV